MYDMSSIHRTVDMSSIHAIVTTCGNKYRFTTFQIMCLVTIRYTCHHAARMQDTIRLTVSIYITLASGKATGMQETIRLTGARYVIIATRQR